MKILHLNKLIYDPVAMDYTDDFEPVSVPSCNVLSYSVNEEEGDVTELTLGNERGVVYSVFVSETPPQLDRLLTQACEDCCKRHRGCKDTSSNITRTTIFEVNTNTGSGIMSIYFENNVLVFEDVDNDTILVDKKSIKDVITVLTEIQESL